CHSKKIYEEAKKQADEKYKADADDGFFEKAGKLLAKTVTKAAISVKENFCANKCELDTPLPWMFVNKEHMIDGAPALTVESQCACRYGGIITIVPEPEEEVTIETEEVALAENMAEPDEVEVKELEKEEWPVELLAGQIPMTSEELEKAKEFSTEKLLESIKGEHPVIRNRGEKIILKLDKYFIEKYVNEETLKEINKQWKNNMSTFKEIYGKDVFDKMQQKMYEYGITDETSILMFLSTIGTETTWGLRTTEYIREDYSRETYTRETRGAGLIQITGVTQLEFLKYMREKLPEKDSKQEVLNSYIENFYTYKITDKLTGYGCKKNATEFIATEYPIESAMWFWGEDKSRCATFKGEEQTDMTVEEYIVTFKNSSISENLFLAVQYSVNGRQDFYKGDLQRICESENMVIENGQADSGKRTSSLPNNWTERIGDWRNAEPLKGE
ncbi:MAG: DUF4280 domain-containing protein, partial [Tyzzerella sp.]|nr:DUF4280 domain-containing protein [Tyzzerella sp.]